MWRGAGTMRPSTIPAGGQDPYFICSKLIGSGKAGGERRPSFNLMQGSSLGVNVVGCGQLCHFFI